MKRTRCRHGPHVFAQDAIERVCCPPAAPGPAERAVTAMLHRMDGDNAGAVHAVVRHYLHLGAAPAPKAAPLDAVLYPALHDESVFSRALLVVATSGSPRHTSKAALDDTPTGGHLLPPCVMRQRGARSSALSTASFWGFRTRRTGSCPTSRAANTTRGQPPHPHPRALRPGQGLPRAVAGRDDELFERLVRRPTPSQSPRPGRSNARWRARWTRPA